MVETGGDADDWEDGALPDIKEVMTELRAVFASFAKRGKMSRIRSRRHQDSDSDDSDSDSSGSEGDSSSDDSEDDEKTHRSRSSRLRTSSKSSDKGIERMKDSRAGRQSQNKVTELDMKDLLSSFRELKVTVAELAKQIGRAHV